jgi:hypothetical protein
MGRKPTDVYAELGNAETLAARMLEKDIGVRRLARYADHRSHSYLSRMKNGDPTARTTTPRTAALIEEALDCRGLLFTLHSVKSPSRTGGK